MLTEHYKFLIKVKKVLLISDYDRLAADLNITLNELNYESSLITTRSLEPNFTRYYNLSKFSNRVTWFLNAFRSFIFRKILFRVKNSSYFQDISENSNYFPLSRFTKISPYKPDYIIILFDYRAITYKTIRCIQNWSNAKILWLMVDMKPFTGGCSYSQGCELYKTDCKSCPAIGNVFFKNFSKKQLEYKKSILKDMQITFVAGSTFQYNQAKSSKLLLGQNVHNINFPVNTNIFSCQDKQIAKSKLGINTNKIVIMFGSTKVDEPRKGYKFIIQSIRKLAEYKNDILLLIVGNNTKNLFDELNIETINLGYVSLEKLSLAYQAADLFLCPTIEDSGPTMVTQSLMCGTPVVAFEMGVSIDLIQHKKNGYLSKLADSDDFLNGILFMLNYIPNNKNNISIECTERVKTLDFKNFVKSIMCLN